MLKMRLQRIGRKNDPSYRVVITDSRNGPRTGNHVDVIGSYHPKMGTFQVDGEKAKKWISQGVQVSDTVHNFLISEKIIEGKKKNVLPRKSPIVDEAKVKAEAEAKAKAEQDAADALAAEKEAKETPAPEAEAPTPEVKEEAPTADTPVASKEEEKVEVA